MYVLLAIAARALIDMNLSRGNTPAYRLDELHRWFEQLDIAEELEPAERRILYTPEQQLEQQEAINSVWRLEGLVILAWALHHAELPTYDQLVETDALLSTLSLLDAPMSRHKLAFPELRSEDELCGYDDHIWTLDWRMVEYRLRPQPIEYAKVDFGWGNFDLSWATLIDGDLALQGTPICKADTGLVSMVSSAALERHKASNFLRGHAELYSDITADT